MHEVIYATNSKHRLFKIHTQGSGNYTKGPINNLRQGQEIIENTHLLKGIFEVDENVTPFLLKKLNVNTNILEQALDKIIESLPKVSGGQLSISYETNIALTRAQNHLKEFNDEYVAIEHLLLALVEGKDKASQMLRDSGVTLKDLKKTVLELRKGQRVIPYRYLF